MRTERARMMPRLSAIPGLPPLIAAAGLLALWEVAARFYGLSSLPPAHEALRELPAILTDKESLLNILASIRRMLVGFALALSFAIPVGLMMGRARLVAAFFNPLLMIIYPVPKAALMPIIMLWLGVGDASKTLVIFLGVSLPVIYHSYQGARAVEEKMLWSAAAMGMDARARMLRIVFPAALPEIMVGIRTGLVLALITMVTSEMIARKQGVGDILFNALAMAQYETVYATIVIIGMMGFVIDVGFERLRAHLVVVGRADARDRGGLDMTLARRGGEFALGVLPIALVLALWHGIAVSGIAPAVLLPPPGAVFARLIQQAGISRVSRPRRHHAVSPVRRLLDRARDRRHARRRGDGEQVRRRHRQAAGARARAAAEGRALSGDDPDPRLRRCLEDRAGRGRRHVPDPACDLSGHVGGRHQAGVVGARGRLLAAPRAVHRGADGGAARRCSPAAASG